jgi:alcohol dehydrogenase class IV
LDEFNSDIEVKSMNFNFYMPTRIIMGEDCIRKQAALMKDLGRKALIVTGTSSAAKNGALRDIKEALESQRITYDIYDKIRSNPSIESVYEGAECARRNGSEFVIGIGGGSPMDAAKAIALLAIQNIREEELFSGKYTGGALPIILVPTTAGTGSEVTPYSILTNDIKQTKTSISTPLIFPKIAFLDARYTMTLPMTETINTALDAFSHAIEGMLTKKATEITDNLALESISRITNCIKRLTPVRVNSESNQLSQSIREKLLSGSLMAGIVIAHTGTTAVHSMGYCLTYFKNVEHGRANALLLPSFLRFYAKSDPEPVKKILNASGSASMDEFEAIFLRLLGEREEITQKELERYTTIAAQAKNVLNSKVTPTREDMEYIYTRSLKISY